jgi:hypothetical protein
VIKREIFIAASSKTAFGFFIGPRFIAEWFDLSHSLEARPGGIFCVDCMHGFICGV